MQGKEPAQVAAKQSPGSTIEYTPSFPVPSPSEGGETSKREGKATASLVLGILGMIVPIVLSILAIVLGRSARTAIRNGSGKRGDGMALSGLTLGVIGVVFWAFVIFMNILDEFIMA